MTVCLYCQETIFQLALACRSCAEQIHLKCLKSKTVPSLLIGDVFYLFTCIACSTTGDEILERDRMSWLDVVLLVLYNLKIQHHNKSNNGYFSWLKTIKPFISSNWVKFFPHVKTKRRSWPQMARLMLSNYPQYFEKMTDDSNVLEEWYKLANRILPNTGLIDKKNNSKLKRKSSPVSTISNGSDSLTYYEDSNLSLGYMSDMTVPDSTRTVYRNQRYESDRNDSGSDCGGDVDIEKIKPRSKRQDDLSAFLFFNEIGTATNVEVDETMEVELEHSNLTVDIRCKPDFTSFFDTQLYEEVIVEENSNMMTKHGASTKKVKRRNIRKKPVKNDGVNSFNTKQMSPAPTTSTNSEGWVIAENTQIEETEILPTNIGSTAQRKQNNKKGERKKKMQGKTTAKTVSQENESGGKTVSKSNVLDRYIYHTSGQTNNSNSNMSLRMRLLGQTERPEYFISPFTNRVLKHFIRRDYETTPLWLKLMSELLQKANKKNQNWKPKKRAPIDYSYVKPQHFPAVNSLARHFFYPGIDLRESLQYPDFSCVVLYKKLIIGFAFLVPDVSFNEAYVSFIFTRPEWRRAGIAKFMMYHLIQTCMGKDITLHVSATNPAILLYQKFGFKIEEFVQDFYDRYLPQDSKECKHAVFLRLGR